jgi:hypothetical protein
MAALPQKPDPKASALFLPHELETYKHWRQSVLNTPLSNNDDILLPTAFEYMDFLAWRRKQRAVLNGAPEADDKSPDPAFSEFILAKRCGHPLHPGDPRLEAQRQQEDEGAEEDEIAWCSMCVLQIHLKLLAELWEKWLDSGGPWRILRPGFTGEDFQIGKRAYYKRKTDLVNDVDHLEDIARLEDAWEAMHPAVDVEAVRLYSAKTAVDTYAKGVQFPARLAETGQTAPRTPANQAQKKRLSYSPDTPEDTRHRSSAIFARQCTAYDPDSLHRCPEEAGWVETSFKNSWEYNVRQCRTLLCNKDPSDPEVTYRELSDDDSKDNLIKGIEEWFGKMQEEWKGPWVNILLNTTDMFLVWNDPPCVEEGDNDFNNWDRADTLVGTNLEAHARRIGDINEDTGTELVEGEVTEDFFDQDSIASDSDASDSESVSDEEPESSDPMDLDQDEIDVVDSIVGQE